MPLVRAQKHTCPHSSKQLHTRAALKLQGSPLRDWPAMPGMASTCEPCQARTPSNMDPKSADGECRRESVRHCQHLARSAQARAWIHDEAHLVHPHGREHAGQRRNIMEQPEKSRQQPAPRWRRAPPAA